MQIYNTLKNFTENFFTKEKGKINIYVCGITVYNYCHIGHARIMIVFDVITRYFRTLGYKVNYVRNITDIDDKIINQAFKNKEKFNILTERMIKAMHEDEKTLRILPPNNVPYATNHINEIIVMIKKLLKKGYAYLADNGNIYYRIKCFKSYGNLNNINFDNLKSSKRIELDKYKENQLDFILWKKYKSNEPYWSSFFGKGRPGWHIECSVMANIYLGDTLDIHGGGIDLTFPHHENEIAQSEAVTGKKYVKIWMHVGIIKFNNEKMSKSLNNFFTIREILKKYHPEVLRFFLISSHYRTPINFKIKSLEFAYKSLNKFYIALSKIKVVKRSFNDFFLKKFFIAMDDDFNTPKAISILFDILHKLNLKLKLKSEEASFLAFDLINLGGILGILQNKPYNFINYCKFNLPLNVKEIEKQIKLREIARNSKNFDESDRIRKELNNLGIFLKDYNNFTEWNI
ncbi:Cysteinyl-tRNA synthetase [Candidatus Johnevansia muelleri]|uniref:Cysteine--tRNA ligase n=1 Tax=Candidatus Johnevansia muelleri TaxID=1495769 RepID=A0A078KBQ3_9GAMM|nr:Cysteinyl-tRNA synthetase [Candidatus Evansia muelleri]